MRNFRITSKGIIFLAATLLWLAFSLYLSHQNGDQTGEVSMGLAQWLFGWTGIGSGALLVLNNVLRKAAHVVLYMVLAVLALLTVRELWRVEAPRDLRNLAAAAVLLIIAVLDEVTKIPIDGRHCDAVDMCLNILGAALGTGIILLFEHRRSRG